jgi:DNA-binding GntR family transcriptional regulator
MGAVLQSAMLRESIWDEHEAMAKAIADGDVERAAGMSEHHAMEARQNLVARLNEVLSHQVA